jgi:putative flippase GtrA
MRTKIITIYHRFRNLILYGIIGGFCAALDFGIFTLLCYYEVLPYLWANVISTHLGIFTSFLLNRSFNFKVKDKIPQRFLSFYAVGLTGLGLSSLMLWLMVDKMKWDELVCKLITIAVVSLVQFVLNKFVTFKQSKQ